ncbi:hypothetical protein ACOSP7_020933 [Xanthoceras sorbifolium]
MIQLISFKVKFHNYQHTQVKDEETARRRGDEEEQWRRDGDDEEQQRGDDKQWRDGIDVAVRCEMGLCGGERHLRGED